MPKDLFLRMFIAVFIIIEKNDKLYKYLSAEIG